MSNQELIHQLQKHHTEFLNYCMGLNDADFLFSPSTQKWTAAQQLEHIVMSVSPLVKALKLPKFVLPFIFGKANRNSKSYAELVAKYHAKLEAGGVASARFKPAAVELSKRNLLKARLDILISKLSKQVGNFSEAELDKLILPHPLLGKITLREMFYFTIYHVQHHHSIIKQNLNNR